MALSEIELDNLAAGDDAATDLIASRHYQYVKMTYGADGTANVVTSTTTNPFPVALSDTDNAVLDQIEVNTSYGDNTGGGVEAGALRVTLANDSTGVLSVDDNGGSLTVDGTVTANLGATDNAVLDQIETNTSYGDSVGGGTEAAALRVTIANDSTGVVSVDDNGGSLTIDNADLTTIAGAVSGSEIQADIVTSALPTGAATAANQLPDGHNVTIDNASGASAVNIQDGGNSITVDGTITANLGATDNAVLDDIAAKLAPNSTNGHSFYLNQDTSAVSSVKGSAGTIYWIACMSTDETPVYLNLYNVASGSVTLGTTTPDLQFIVPSQGDANGSGFTINFGPLGIQFGTAITVACATTFNGSTDPGTNIVITNIGYE